MKMILGKTLIFSIHQQSICDRDIPWRFVAHSLTVIIIKTRDYCAHIIKDRFIKYSP